MSFITFLQHAWDAQMACDESIEAAYADALAVVQWTSKVSGASKKGNQLLDALRSSSVAVVAVGHLAHVIVSAAPLRIPDDCVSLTPSAALHSAVHHIIVCIAIATKTAFDPKWLEGELMSYLPQWNQSIPPADVSNHNDGDDDELVRSKAAHAAATTQTATRFMSELVRLAANNATQLYRVCCKPLNDETSEGCHYSRTPKLLEAWIRVAFYGDVDAALAIVSPLTSGISDFDPRTITPAADEVTIADALCLHALLLMLSERAERALPLLSEACRVAAQLRDDIAGWKCARGGRVQILALILRAECKRLLKRPAESESDDWLEDLRLAARLSSDESRQFAGVRLGKDDLFWSSPAAVAGNTGDSCCNLRMLPRLVHRMFHLYSGGMFLSSATEASAQSEILSLAASRCSPQRTLRSGTTEGQTARAVADAAFWYDLMHILSPEHDVQGIHRGNEADGFCQPPHPSIWLTSTGSSQCDASSLPASEWLLRDDATLPRGRKTIRAVQSLPCLMNWSCGVSNSDERFQHLLLEFVDPTQGGGTQKGASASQSGPPFALRASHRPSVSAPSLSRRSDDGKTADGQRKDQQQRRDEPLKPAVAPRKVQYAFNSSYIVPSCLGPLGDADRTKGAPRSQSSVAAAAAPATSRQTRPSSATNVFDRLTTPTSARSARSSSVCAESMARSFSGSSFAESSSKRANSFRERVRSGR